MDSPIQVVVALPPPAQWCQAFFALASAGIIGINILPADMRKSLMDYGARRPNGHSEGSGDNKSSSPSAAAKLVAWIMDHAQVPHAWFLHFYIVSVSWSLFWAWQYLSRGAVLREVALAQNRAQGPSMEISQVFVAWLLMALQGTRRLYESMFVSKMGSSPMSFVHWALGICYYSAMGVSVWVEGSSKTFPWFFCVCFAKRLYSRRLTMIT
jgi:3-oxo-5-alpha-steroid 4-dehydrogenase 3 / polyprenol reductase